MNRYTIALIVNNQSGVLSKIAGLFTRRGYNIENLSVGPMENNNLSRMTIVFNGDKSTLEQVKKQFNKLIDVIKVIDLSEKASVFRELVLIKIAITTNNKHDLIDITNTFRGNIIDYNKKSIIIEMTGKKDKIDAFISLISSYEIKEIVRTGSIGLIR
jgi:acetolactate synthase-1/3 small subunit